MSFSPEIFRKKLDALQETQDSIVSISQWVLFHHRHAAQLCELWAEYSLTNNATAPSKKKLSLLYLCNDVVQQARHKRKPEFTTGFAAKLPEVIHAIYGTVDASIQPKIERLISVWSQRSVFTKPQIESMDHAVRLSKAGDDYSEDPSANAKPNKGTQGPQIATDLVHLNNLYTHMTALLDTSSANLASVGQQSKMYLPEDPANSDNLPSPKVYVSKLSVMEKLCQMTIQNLGDTKKARADILTVLGQLTSLVDSGASGDDTKMAHLQQKLAQISATRAELMEMIDEPVAKPNQENDDELEEPSPAFESASDPIQEASETLIPTYEDSSDDSDDSDSEPLPPPKRTHAEAASDDSPVTKKRTLSESSSSAGSKKSVAFSEEIEVKEYERDDQANYIDVMGEFGQEEDGNVENEEYGNGLDFEAHHKDAVELMHERQEENHGSNGSVETDKSGLLGLLSKLG